MKLQNKTAYQKLLSPQTITLTANARMADFLQQKLMQECYQDQNTAVKANIYAISTWSQELVQEGMFFSEAKLLLPKNVSLQKWRQIIQDSEYSQILMRIHETAKCAYQAYSVVEQWCVDIDKLSQTDKLEAQVFNQWLQTYNDWLDNNQYLDQNQILAYLPQIWADLSLVKPINQIILYGFEEITPALKNFMEFLKQTIDIDEILLPDAKGNELKKFAYHDVSSEYFAAANWALENRLAGNKVAIVLPDLADNRQLVDQIFSDVFEPQHLLKANPSVIKAYNISTGIPLAKYPAISAILRHLTTGKAFYSDYIANAKLFNVNQIATPLSYHDFRVWLQNYLAEIGWPGRRSLNSIEYQSVQRFYELLNDYDQFDILENSLTLSEHIAWIGKLCSDCPFQAENKEATVQILGQLEAAGLEFDAIWVTGCYQELWPNSPEPNPFIDVFLQRSLNMPHASAEREAQFAKNILQRYLVSADSIVFSMPNVVSNNEVVPSSLVLSLDNQAFEYQSINVKNLMLEVSQLESNKTKFNDYAPIPITNAKDLHGGSQLLSLQADCPFKSFVYNRIKINEPPEQTKGISFVTRGVVIHKVVEQLYLEYKNTGLENAPIEQIIEITFKQYNDLLKDVAPIVKESEKIRMFKLIKQLLELEADREPFEVQSLEQQKFIQIGSLSLKLRIDRIDKTADGVVLLDYKTGVINVNELLGYPPNNTQMPLYLHAFSHLNPQAIGIISLTSEGVALFGVANEINEQQMVPISESKAYTDWDDLKQKWEQWLIELALAYERGENIPNPRNAQLCHYCTLPSMCRILERGA